MSNEFGGATNAVLSNEAELSWYSQELLVSLTDSVSLVYRIPTLLIQKTGTTANSNSERFASYTVLVQNSSLVPAFDIDLIDELDSK